ncbi:MAG: hypothetical protein ACXU85_08550 [Xanthobacteraceae bacterium]
MTAASGRIADVTCRSRLASGAALPDAAYWVERIAAGAASGAAATTAGTAAAARYRPGIGAGTARVADKSRRAGPDWIGAAASAAIAVGGDR